MMTQTVYAITPQAVDEVSVVSEGLATKHLKAQAIAVAQTKDETAGSSPAGAFLPVEEDGSVPFPAPCGHYTIASETLNKFRHGYREHVAQIAQQLKGIAVTSAEGILQKAKLILDMKLSLNRKEWGVWLREVLGWFGNEATPYLQIAKVFKDFQPVVFRDLEPFTILKLRTKRYEPVVTRLREELAISSQVVQNFIKEVTPKQPRKKKAVNYGDAVLKQRLNAKDGTFYFTLNANLAEKSGSWLQEKLENCTVGQVLEQAAALEKQVEEHSHSAPEGIGDQIEQRVSNRVEIAAFGLRQEIADLRAQLQTSANRLELVKQTTSPSAPHSPEQKEAITLRVQHKFAAQPDQHHALQSEELQAVMERSPSPENSRQGERLPSSNHAVAELEEKPALAVVTSETEVAIASVEVVEDLEAQVAVVVPVRAEYEVAATEVTDCLEAEPVESPAIRQEDKLLASTSADYLEPSNDDPAADRQPITPPWTQLKQIRDAEGYLQEIDTQIKVINSKLAIPGLERQIERELKGVLTNRQKLHSTKIAQIVNLADANGIPADYQALQSLGRVVLVPEYASKILKQAKSWADVVLVSGSDRSALLKAVKNWTYELKQLLVQLLSAYLETEPSAFDQINWIPEKLLNKALSALSFTLEKIKQSDNLVDDPEFEKFCGCKFKSVAHISTPNEQWFFESSNKVFDVFGRSGFAVEKF